MARDIVIGLDPGTSAIKIVVAEHQEGGELRILGAVQKPSQGFRHGYIIDQESATKSIYETVKEAERVSGIPIKHAFVSIGGIKLEAMKAKGSVIVSRADNEITDYDVKRAISQSETNLSRITNRRIIHSIPIYFKIEGEVVLGRPIGMKGEKLEVETLFATCINQHLASLIKSVESAGIIIDDIIASPLAASYAVLNKRHKEVGSILADIGAGTTSIAVFEEGIPISLETFPFGSSHITNDIALGLQISLDEAENLKLNYASDNQKKKLGDIIEARLKDVFELIESHLKKINRSGLLPAGIIFAGGGANLINLDGFAKSTLKLPAKTGILMSLKSQDKQIVNPRWATALGLCVLGADEALSSNLGMGTAPGPRHPLLRWLKSFLP